MYNQQPKMTRHMKKQEKNPSKINLEITEMMKLIPKDVYIAI
jgi:hypothetical protein